MVMVEVSLTINDRCLCHMVSLHLTCYARDASTCFNFNQYEQQRKIDRNLKETIFWKGHSKLDS